MTNRFRPQVNALEARDVPAAFSFVLPDGSVGSGQFSTPEPPGSSVQTVPVPDLTVTVGGATYVVLSGATARYTAGELTGVTATAVPDVVGPVPDADVLHLTPGYAQRGSSANVAVALDKADTQLTFTLPADPTSSSPATITGAISFAVPWDQVDATQASQTLAVSAFNLNIAGQNISSGLAATPTATFEHGHFVGIAFDLGTTGVTAALAYTRIRAESGFQILATPSAPAAPQQVVQADGDNWIRVNFNDVTVGKDYKVKIQLRNADGTEFLLTGQAAGANTTTVTIGSGATKDEVIQSILEGVAGLKKGGYQHVKIRKEANGTVRFAVNTNSANFIKSIEFTLTKLNGDADNTLVGPKYRTDSDLGVSVNGSSIVP
ncbi:MAG: hypothetical protein K2V38_14900 [Gemmataceae bacterium]|nr:hypothetical protein [Gemmataceae bacterium]